MTVCDAPPPVIVPLLMDHEYVLAAELEAVLPVELAHAVAEAGVITGAAAAEQSATESQTVTSLSVGVDVFRVVER